MNKSHEPKTKSERKDRSIYISRKIHADKLQAKAEVADIDLSEEPREYTDAELDRMLAEHDALHAMGLGLSPEAWF